MFDLIKVKHLHAVLSEDNKGKTITWFIQVGDKYEFMAFTELSDNPEYQHETTGVLKYFLKEEREIINKFVEENF